MPNFLIQLRCKDGADHVCFVISADDVAAARSRAESALAENLEIWRVTEIMDSFDMGDVAMTAADLWRAFCCFAAVAALSFVIITIMWEF
jgi:hypothetical protein